MKVKEYLRQPHVRWVNHGPTQEREACLLTAVYECYPARRAAIFLLISEAIHERDKTTHGISCWNDTHTKQEVLDLVDYLDI